MERTFKCQTCKKDLDFFEIHFLPGETYIDPITKEAYSSGTHYCEKCYKDATGEELIELEKQNKKEKVLLKEKKNQFLDTFEWVNIKDLKTNHPANVLCSVILKKDERKIQKDDINLRVADFLIEDDTGKTVLVVWNELIDKIKIGKTYIIKGFIQEWKGVRQVTLGKFGRIIEL